MPTKGLLVLMFLMCIRMSTAQGGYAMDLKSTAFSEGGMIPAHYTCDGRDVSPPLTWAKAPSGTKSFAIICDDPDAPGGTWVHWVYYDIPSTTTGLAENITKSADPPSGGKQGINDFGKAGYGGPCPPGGTHRYFFRLYALDAVLGLPAGTGKQKLLKVMEGHVLGQAQLMGKYKR